MNYCLLPGSGYTDFAPVVPTSGPALLEWYLAVKGMISAANFDFFSGFHAYCRYMLPIVLVVYAPEERERASELCQKLIDNAEFMCQIRSHFLFNGHAIAKLVDCFKADMDLNNVLSPGKSGVKGTKEKSFS
ncbi:Vanillyl-alcohol oxidase [Fusarium oxysporum f. sp. cubense race 1]|uniref:Vanillyl-alcohol oxidase n=1 Tax=Fusarium oxysporum f. sp. cubense (strain race 1) TaxID=1229664 RepID=N4TWY8_FUSC1|nr:Vanillyl-alcohol oxidase [Fusarium oxysporum f. sp. cubense race 1]